MARFAGIASGDVIGRLALEARAVMAAEAIAGDAGMIEGRRYPRRSVMTAFTTVAGRHVIGGLTHRCGAVMATGAIADDTGVIETRRCPQAGVVAGLAIAVRLNMSGRFTGGDAVIVAAAARAFDRGVIDARNHIPMRTAVARAAIGAGIDMAGRLSGCRYQAALRMAAGAIARRAFELTFDVAALAGQMLMRSFEWKTGFEMIEFGCGNRRCTQR